MHAKRHMTAWLSLSKLPHWFPRVCWVVTSDGIQGPFRGVGIQLWLRLVAIKHRGGFFVIARKPPNVLSIMRIKSRYSYLSSCLTGKQAYNLADTVWLSGTSLEAAPGSN